MTLRTKLQNFTTPLTRNFQKGIEHKENQTKCRNRTRKPRSHVTHKFIPPPWHKGTGGGGIGGGGGWMKPLFSAFDMLQYFETILPLVESL